PRPPVVMRDPVVDQKHTIERQRVPERGGAVRKRVEILQDGAVLEPRQVAFVQRGAVRLHRLRIAGIKRRGYPRRTAGRLVPDGSTVLGESQAEVESRGRERGELVIEPSDAQKGVLLDEQKPRRSVHGPTEAHVRLLDCGAGTYAVRRAIPADHGA